jgi:hypothetical protein
MNKNVLGNFMTKEKANHNKFTVTGIVTGDIKKNDGEIDIVNFNLYVKDITKKGPVFYNFKTSLFGDKATAFIAEVGENDKVFVEGKIKSMEYTPPNSNKSTINWQVVGASYDLLAKSTNTSRIKPSMDDDSDDLPF